MKTSRQRHAKGGYSLVELLVAVAVGMALMGAVAQVFVSNKVGFQLQNDFSFMQDNARYALASLDYHIRMADHWGGVEASQVNVTAASVAGITDAYCSTTWVLPTAGTDVDGVTGYDGGSSFPVPNCTHTGLNNSDYAPNTDVLILRYAHPDAALAFNASTSYSAGDYATSGTTLYQRIAAGSGAWDVSEWDTLDNTPALRSSAGERGEFLISSGLGALTYPSALPDSTHTFNFLYKAYAFFIRNCSDQGADNVCDASDDDGDPIPTLAMLTLSAGTVIQEELVEGVEQMQFSYGVDSDGDGSADRYYAATAITDWTDVVTVRMSLIVQADRSDASFTDGNTYAMAGSYSYTPATSEQNRHRKLFTKVVQIRNRLRK